MNQGHDSQDSHLLWGLCPLRDTLGCCLGCADVNHPVEAGTREAYPGLVRFIKEDKTCEQEESRHQPAGARLGNRLADGGVVLSNETIALCFSWPTTSHGQQNEKGKALA